MYCKMLIAFMFIFILNGANSVPDIKGRLHKCRDDLKSLDKCLADVIRDIKPFLTQGIPELNIPVLEPMLLENLDFVQQEGPVNIRARFKDVYVHGFTNFSLVDLRTNLENQELRARITVPHLKARGSYLLDGNLLFLPIPITGNGPFVAHLQNIDLGLLSKIAIKNDTGVERLGLRNTRVNFKLSKARTMLKNLFNGDKFLGDTVNHFLNENDQLILKEVKPAVSRDVALLIEGILDNALSTLPVSLLLPDAA